VHQVPSLQAVCAHWLRHALSKEEQCSDWAARPLSATQMAYAATDASACLRVLAVMRQDWGERDEEPLHRRVFP
jgi:ribonuclease D